MPKVSKYSKVKPISKIDFTPAETIATFVVDISVKSAEISIEFSAPRCTPPIPPVTKILMPTIEAILMVAATVVAPYIFLLIT